MKKTVAAVAFGICWILGPCLNDSIVAQDRNPTRNKDSESALQFQELANDLDESWRQAFTPLDRYARQQVEDYALPGLAIALTDKDRPLGIGTDGYANLDARRPVKKDTRFLMGSIRKSFTAIAILQEIERGTIDLHAPVNKYLPWFEVESEYPSITVHDLLTHTAGIINGSDLAPYG